MMAKQFLQRCLGLLVLLGVLLTGTQVAQAGKPYLETGAQIDTNEPYQSAQDVGDVFASRAVYGKLEGETPVDIFSFVAQQDGEQTFSLLVPAHEVGEESEPILILIDPTENTEAQELGLPLPTSDLPYHSTLLTQKLDPKEFYTESVLFEKYQVTAGQKVKLTKDTQYYLIVLDTTRLATHYAIRFGESKAWSGGDFFRYFGSWVQLRSDSYAGSSPFGFTSSQAGFLIVLLGLISLFSGWLLVHFFALSTQRSKLAAYLLIKLQPYSTILIWVGIWFAALGGYMYFMDRSWSGVPFLALIVFLPLAAILLFQTLVLSPQIKALEPAKPESTIPLALRKKLFISFVSSSILIACLLVLLTMQAGQI